VHPRTQKFLKVFGLLGTLPKNIIMTHPLGYLDMIQLMGAANKILTDSGGMQKEAHILGVPCITLRENTEWTETLHDGWNLLTGSDRAKILSAISMPKPECPRLDLYPGGACKKIRKILDSY
jgi:UDP-N-acetylglucosamine 2-epimerase (non-hydrolysing)